MKYSVCKFCDDNDDYYGCTNEECSVYQDIKSDSMLQDHFDNMREEEIIEGMMEKGE